MALPLAALYFLYRGFGGRGYWKSLAQRLGFLPASFKQTGPGAIWLHAVSVGEILASIEFLKGLRALIDARIEQVSKANAKGEKIEVE